MVQIRPTTNGPDLVLLEPHQPKLVGFAESLLRPWRYWPHLLKLLTPQKKTYIQSRQFKAAPTRVVQNLAQAQSQPKGNPKMEEDLAVLKGGEPPKKAKKKAAKKAAAKKAAPKKAAKKKAAKKK